MHREKGNFIKYDGTRSKTIHLCNLALKRKSIATDRTNVSHVIYTCPISTLLATNINFPMISTSFDKG